MNPCHCYHIVHSVIVQPLNFKEFYFGSIKVTFCGSSLSSRAVVDKIQCQPSGFYTTKVVYFLLQYYMILKFVPVDFTLIKFACNLNRSLIFTPTLTVHWPQNLSPHQYAEGQHLALPTFLMEALWPVQLGTLRKVQLVLLFPENKCEFPQYFYFFSNSGHFLRLSKNALQWWKW